MSSSTGESTTSPAIHAPTSSTLTSSQPSSTSRSILSRFLPSSISPNADRAVSTSTSFHKIFALAWPERRPLLMVIGLCLSPRPYRRVSCSQSGTTSTTSSNLVSPSPQPPLLETSKYGALPTCQYNCDTELNLTFPYPQMIPYSFTLTQATVGLLLIFMIGRACNVGCAFLMRIFGASCSSFPSKHSSNLFPRLANRCSSPQTNLCCDSLARSQVCGAWGVSPFPAL